MTDGGRPWEPPLAGAETEHLLGGLERLRTTFRWKADDLDAAGLQTRIGASSLTIGSLLKHPTRAEDEMVRQGGPSLLSVPRPAALPRSRSRCRWGSSW